MAYHWAPLAEGQTPRIYAPGQLIYLQGTEADVFYYLLSGHVGGHRSNYEEILLRGEKGQHAAPRCPGAFYGYMVVL